MSLHTLLSRYLSVQTEFDTYTRTTFQVANYKLAMSVGKKLGKAVYCVLQNEKAHFVVYLHDDNYLDIFGVWKQEEMEEFWKVINKSQASVALIPEAEVPEKYKSCPIDVEDDLLEEVSFDLVDLVESM